MLGIDPGIVELPGIVKEMGFDMVPACKFVADLVMVSSRESLSSCTAFWEMNRFDSVEHDSMHVQVRLETKCVQKRVWNDR